MTFVTIVRAVTAATPIRPVAEFAEHSRSPIQRGKPHPSGFFPSAKCASEELELKFSPGDQRDRARVAFRGSNLAGTSMWVLKRRTDCPQAPELLVEKLFIDLRLARLSHRGRAAECGPAARFEPVAFQGTILRNAPIFSQPSFRARSDAPICSRRPIVGTA